MDYMKYVCDFILSSVVGYSKRWECNSKLLVGSIKSLNSSHRALMLPYGGVIFSSPTEMSYQVHGKNWKCGSATQNDGRNLSPVWIIIFQNALAYGSRRFLMN